MLPEPRSDLLIAARRALTWLTHPALSIDMAQFPQDDRTSVQEAIDLAIARLRAAIADEICRRFGPLLHEVMQQLVVDAQCACLHGPTGEIVVHCPRCAGAMVLRRMEDA